MHQTHWCREQDSKFRFLVARPSKRHGRRDCCLENGSGSVGEPKVSNPSPSSGESIANLTLDETDRPFHEDQQLDDEGRGYLGEKLTELHGHLDTLGARVTLLALEEVQQIIKYSGTTWGHVTGRLQEIRNTLKRELSLLTLLVLEPKEQAYFEPKEPHFGIEVALKFISTVDFEIDEGAKCLALGRSTAAVFHLMRVMEIGIRAVARCLQIPDPVRAAERNWGNILREIKADLDAHIGPAHTKTWTVPDRRSFFRHSGQPKAG